jgi:KAP-like P-loop domain-containing protein
MADAPPTRLPGRESQGPTSSADSGGNSTAPSASSDSLPRSPTPANSERAVKFPLRTLADAPVDDDAADRFGYRDIADGLARLIDGGETATPLTIAVSAPWGAGKTSLLRLVESRVVRQPVAQHEAPAIVVWFNAWMHDAAPNLSAALAADIARHATRCRDPWTRLWYPLPSSMLSPQERARRRFWLGVVALGVAVAIYPLVSFLVGPSHSDINEVRAAFGASAVGWFALLWGISALWPRVQRSVAAVAAFVDDPRSAAATGSMTEVSAQLGQLIREAQDGVQRAWRAPRRPRFVVVVDDLERCQPPKAADMCEVAAQLLDHPDVITVLVGDQRIIAASAELKYRDAVDLFSKEADFAEEGFGRFFLQKVVQFELELPPISENRLREMARSAPASGSLYGSGADRSTPMPSLLRRLLRSPGTIAFAVVPVLVILLLCVIFVPGDRGALLAALLGTAGACIIGIPATITVLGYRRRRIEQFRAEVNGLVDNVISDVLSDPEAPKRSDAQLAAVSAQVREEIAARYPPSRSLWPVPYFLLRAQDLLRHAQDLTSDEGLLRRLQLRAAADEETRKSAEEVILELLPKLPRTAKRLLNRLYFLLVVAYNRNLIVRGCVTAQQLGKWAVLLDRWPEAGKAIVRNPALAGKLENAAGREDRFQDLCAEYTPPLAGDLNSLRKFFQSEHKLAAAALYLAYLDADVTPQASEAPANGQAAFAGT